MMTAGYGQGPGVERQLDVMVERLSPLADNPAARALLIEARRVRSVIDNWRSVPPPAHVREEMLSRVMHLSSAMSDLLPPSTSRGPMHIPAAPPSTAMRHGAEETVITEGHGALPITPLDVHPVTINEDVSPHLAMIKDPYSIRADAYRALRHQLSKRGDPKVIGVTSAARQRGQDHRARSTWRRRSARVREGACCSSRRTSARRRSRRLLGFMPPDVFPERAAGAPPARAAGEPWVAARGAPVAARASPSTP
jgi:hypothetical protein